VEHWDRAWDEENLVTVDSSSFPHNHNATEQFFAERIHDLPKSRVLEIGCGSGQIAVHLAKRGAAVTAVDVSSRAVEVTRKNAEHNGVADRVSVRKMDALEVNSLSHTYDFIVGRFVLHHIEPFQTFTEVLDSVTAPSARGVFLENSARNRLLMLCREYLTGRLGIPKYGDDQEYPLTRNEIDTLRTRFDVRVHHPELVLLKKLNTYVIGYENRFERLVEVIKSLDDALYRYLPFLRKYSYLQVVEISK
jgi:ubiquinone/menaquinone biosynthesis C-methylase UbiE